MKLEGKDILLSAASDLMRFMGCVHATAMDLRSLRGERLTPAEDTEDAKLLQQYRLASGTTRVCCRRRRGNLGRWPRHHIAADGKEQHHGCNSADDQPLRSLSAWRGGGGRRSLQGLIARQSLIFFWRSSCSAFSTLVLAKRVASIGGRFERFCVLRISCSSRPNSSAVWKRLSRSLQSARATTSITGFGTPGTYFSSEGGSSLRMPMITVVRPSPSNGLRPVSSS